MPRRRLTLVPPHSGDGASPAPPSSTPPAQSLRDWYKKHLARGLKPAPFHLRKVDMLEQLARRQLPKRRLMDMEPPGHAKTTVGVYTFVPWYMKEFPGHSVMVISYDTKRAGRVGRRVRNICQHEAKNYPTLKLETHSHGSHYFVTKGGNEFFAAGWNGSLAGDRVDCLVIDDPVKSKPEAESATKMAELFEIYKSVVIPRLKPGGIVAANLTRFGLADWAARVLAYDGAEWAQLVFPAQAPTGEYLWGEYIDLATYENAKRDEEVWWAVWQQNPRAFITSYFEFKNLCFYDDPPKKSFNTYIFCDPARSKSHTSDQTCMIMLAAGPEGRLFVVDWIYDRLDPEERADALVRLIRRWPNTRQLLYEEYGMVEDTFYLSKRFEKEQIELRPISIGRHGPRSFKSKDSRIRELVPDFRDGKIWLPRRLLYKRLDGRTTDVIAEFLNDELIPYRGPDSIPHDDGLDTLSRIHEPVFKPEFAESPDMEMDLDDVLDGSQQRGSWEATY